MTAMYKFIPYSEWMATETITNEEDNMYERRTCPSFHKHPNARVNIEQTEVVVSCNCGDGTHTKEQALKHIEDNWAKAPEQEV